MKVQNKVEEPMYNRTVLTYTIDTKGVTPARGDLQKDIAKDQKTKPEMVVVNSIEAVYGKSEFAVEAMVYADVDSYKKFVPKYLAKKSEVKEEPKSEPEAPAEAAPAEETKEEAPAEEGSEKKEE